MKYGIAFLLLMCGWAAAGQNFPINSDRPGQSLTARTLEQGLFQIQAGLNAQFLISQFSSKTSPAPSFETRVGLTDYLELNVGYLPEFFGTDISQETFAFGLRGNFIQNERWALGAAAGYKSFKYPPLDTSALYVDPANGTFYLRGLFDVAFKNGLSLFGNLGMETRESSEIRNGTVVVPFTLGLTGGSKWGWYVEVFGITNEQLGLNGGGYYQWHPSFRLDLQVGHVSLFNNPDFVFSGLGFTWKPFNR
jgi:hypothetical protein